MALAAHATLTLIDVPQESTIMVAAVLVGAAGGYWLQVRLILRPLRKLQFPTSDGGAEAAIRHDEIDNLVVHLNDTLKHLALSEAHFRAVINTAADGFITFDESVRILWLNRSAQKMFACESQQVVGKPLKSLIPISGELAVQLQAVSTGEVKLFTPKRVVEGSRLDLSRFPVELSVG